mgnify:CR=1 FL=1
MWVNSKQAAEILGVNNKSVEKAAFRATKSCKKFCTIKCHLCHFTYTDGIGRGGKTLQIWLDEEVVRSYDPDLAVKLASSEISTANMKESRDSFDDRRWNKL